MICIRFHSFVKGPLQFWLRFFGCATLHLAPRHYNTLISEAIDI